MLITATYDGKVFKPKTPLDLDIDQEYQIEVINDVNRKDTDNISFNQNPSEDSQKAKAVAKLLVWTQEHKFRLEGGIPSRDERNAR